MRGEGTAGRLLGDEIGTRAVEPRAVLLSTPPLHLAILLSSSLAQKPTTAPAGPLRGSPITVFPLSFARHSILLDNNGRIFLATRDPQSAPSPLQRMCSADLAARALNLTCFVQILWYGSHLFVFGYGWYSQQSNARLAGLNSLKWSVWSSRGAGLVLAYDGAMILVPMLRNIIRVIRPKFTWLFPADENIWFHRQVAYSMAFWTMVHTTAHYVNFINVERTRK